MQRCVSKDAAAPVPQPPMVRDAPPLPSAPARSLGSSPRASSHHEAPREARSFHPVMAGPVPAIPLRRRMCSPDRDHRDKPGDDGKERGVSKLLTYMPIVLSLSCSSRGVIMRRLDGGAGCGARATVRTRVSGTPWVCRPPQLSGAAQSKGLDVGRTNAGQSPQEPVGSDPARIDTPSVRAPEARSQGAKSPP